MIFDHLKRYQGEIKVKKNIAIKPRKNHQKRNNN